MANASASELTGTTGDGQRSCGAGEVGRRKLVKLAGDVGRRNVGDVGRLALLALMPAGDMGRRRLAGDHVAAEAKAEAEAEDAGVGVAARVSTPMTPRPRPRPTPRVGVALAERGGIVTGVEPAAANASERDETCLTLRRRGVVPVDDTVGGASF